MLNRGFKRIWSSVTGGGNSDATANNSNQPQTRYHTRSKSLGCVPTTSKQDESFEQTIPDLKPNKKIKLKALHQDAENSFEKIQREYSNLYRKFLDISSNKKNKPAFLELIEELDQLVFSLDKVEVGNYEELKDERRELLKLVQALTKQVKIKIEDNTKKEKVDDKNNEDIFEDVFKFGNTSYQNLVFDTCQQMTNVHVLDTAPQVVNYSVGQWSEQSHIEQHMMNYAEQPSVSNTGQQSEQPSVGQEIGHLIIGQSIISGTHNGEHSIDQSNYEQFSEVLIIEQPINIGPQRGEPSIGQSNAKQQSEYPIIEHQRSGLHFVDSLNMVQENLDGDQTNGEMQFVIKKEETIDISYSPNSQASTSFSASQEADSSNVMDEVNYMKPVINNQQQQQLAPIQLLVRNAEGLFELDEAAVTGVLCAEEVKNKKIAILSVVGAFRRGKSFLLNFMLRYLKAQRVPDWLTQSDEIEGFSWRGGKERETTGILMWPEVFLVEDDIALILLDTQGTFDRQTSMKENTFIFALSTLLSSVQIYNLHERIQMDDLTNLQYFLEFGRMVQTECNDKVFENLIFLIRDWKFDTENGFGFEGGQKELDDWFKMEYNRERAEMIQTCFKQVLCFLMPYPGDQVSRNQNFKGTLSEIEPEFLDQLKLLIESLFYPGHLAVKQIGGECIRAQDFLVYMKNYVEKLQQPDLEPRTLFQSMSETCHEKAMSEAKHMYMQDMEAGLTDAAVDIQVLHQSALETACRVYDSTPKFGSNYNTTSYRKKLVENLDELYGRYSREFKLHSESCFDSACNDIYETYQTTLTTFCMQLNPECTLDEKCKQACRYAVNNFANLKFKVPKHVRNKKLLELHKKMRCLYSQQVPYFQARQEFMQVSKRQQQYTEVKHKVVKCYQQTMDTYCGGPEPVLDFDKVHSRAEFRAFKLVHEDIEKYQLTDCHQLQMEIIEEISEMCKRYKEVNQTKIDKKKEDRFQLLMVESCQSVIDTYRRLMEEECGGLKMVEDIEQLHKAANKKAMALLYNHIREYGESCRPFVKNSRQNIANLFTQYKQHNKDKQKHNVRERAWQLLSSACRYYDEQMGLLKVGTDPVQDLQQKHITIWKAALDMLNPVENYEYYSKIKFNLEETIGRRYNYFIEMNNARVHQAELDSNRAKLEECVKCYEDKMNSLRIDQHPITNLVRKHAQFFIEAKSKLQELNQHLGQDLNTMVDTFEQEIEKKWQTYQESNNKMLELFSNEDKRTVMLAYNTMKTQFTTNMQRQMSAAVNTKDPSLLYQEYQKQKATCIATFRNLTQENSEENRQEYLHKLENDIRTSYEEIEETYAKNVRDLRVKEEKLKKNALKTYAIGIDLGTTNCCAAVYRAGNVKIIFNSIEKTTTPSVVCFKDKETVFGETAVRAGVVYPENCISEMKCIIGRRFDDPVVQAKTKKWPFKVTKSSQQMPVVQVTNGSKSSYKPEEISALVLGEMKRIAEVYLGSKVHDAVVTIPAYFNEPQREATKAACVLAGLNVLRIINEPTAAAIAFGLQCKSEESRTILVYDFGGGTCDISIVEVKGEKFTVKASKGDNQLGGEDFDDLLTDHVTKIIQQKYNVVVDTKDRRRLRHNCERVKRNLSEMSNYRLQIEKFTTSKVDVDVLITREEFENVNEDLFERVLTPVEECLDEAKCSKEKIDEVVLVGGMSRMPKIRQKLREFFNGKKMNVNINPDEAIAYGAAVQAAICTGEYKGEIEISDITPISLGVGTYPDHMSIVVKKNSKIPCSETSCYGTVENYQTSLKFRLYQGECKEDRHKNTKIGEFTLTGLTPAPAHQTEANLTFTIDADGILHVEAVEVGKENNKKAITIKKSVL